MKNDKRGLPVGMWLLGRSSGGNVPNPAPTCAKCGRADWAHTASDGHEFARKES